MPNLDDTEVLVHPGPAAGSEAMAAEVVRLIAAAVAESARCAIALSGGNTPRHLHLLLATRHHNEIDWPALHLFFGDERYVPPDSPASNLRMARETLIDQVPLPAGNLHPIPTDPDDPGEAAQAYERTLREWAGDGTPRLDLVLLGMGADGHTASLFPGSWSLDEQERLVVPSLAPEEPRQRITMTYPMINNAAAAFFLVVGEEKAPMVARALNRATPKQEVPATGVHPTDGRLAWWLDEAAASLL